jgi:hypothetical protein
MSTQITPQEISARTGVPIAALGRDRFPFVSLDANERMAIQTVLMDGLAHLRRVAPELYDALTDTHPVTNAKPNLVELAVTFAGIAKAMLPSQKPYTFPSTPGKLGVAWLFPQAIKPTTATASGYNVNSWDIPITAGTKAYILGSDAAFYTAPTYSIGGKTYYTAILIFHYGLVEVGSTPSAQQFRLISSAKTDYGIYAVEPLVEAPLDAQKSLYLYPTPMGALFIDYTTGVKWYFMPNRTGTSTMKLLGLVFYEHEVFQDTAYVSTT